MPGEFEAHEGCVMIWPIRPGSWPHGAKEAQETFVQVAGAIAKSEHVWMLCHEPDLAAVRRAFAGEDAITVLPIATDDAWARDVGPTCVVMETEKQKEHHRTVRGINWKFNAWGGDVDGLYTDYARDDKAAAAICDALDMDYYDAGEFVLEGGSIHSDGEGTLLVTERCLLSAGRNPNLTKQQIEDTLCAYLGAQKVIWLPYGIYNDETNEHVDNVCAFVRPAEVVLAWTEDEKDPQYAMSMADAQVLANSTDAKGRPFVVHKLPIPRKPVCITEEEMSGFVFEEGEDVREVGERLAASYVNFYIANKGVVVPQFGDEMDARAVQILTELFPERTIYPIFARPIIVGGGNIHCITQQIPAR